MSWSNASAQKDSSTSLTTSSITTPAIVSALKTIPEFRVSLIELARKVTRRGKVDMEKAVFNHAELDRAIDEAKAYAVTTRRAVECLKRLAR